MRPDRSRPGGRALVGSVLLHAALLALLLSGVVFAQSPEPTRFKAYRVELIAAPPPAPVAKETPAAEKQPAAAPKPVPKTPPKTPPKKPAPKPKTEEKPKSPQPTPPAEKTESKEKPAGEPEEEKTSGAGKDALDMSQTGAEFAYPDYLENIITQIHRYFRWTGTSRPSAEVYFVINRDGSVGDIRLVRRSGNPAFDFEAIGAIEQAGRRRAFGPLPKGFPQDRLPLRFEFKPPQ